MESLSKEINKVSDTLLSYSKKQSIADLTSNRSPFTKKEVYPQLSQLVNQITTLECLRKSKDVIKLLQTIIDGCVATILAKCWKIQSIKPRLDAMMKMAVPFLCTPLMTSMLNIGEYVYILCHDIKQNRQMCEYVVTLYVVKCRSLSTSSALVRIKKCIVDIFTFFINSELSILKNGE